MESIGEHLEQIYVNLSNNHRNISMRIICKVCKRARQIGKLPKFVVPKRIRPNNSLSVVTTLSKIEERFVVLRIEFEKIRQ